MKRRRKTPYDDVLIRAAGILAEPTAPEVDLAAEYAALAESYSTLLRKLHKTLVISDSYQVHIKEVSRKLEDATLKYRQLTEVALPICMYCKKIRTDNAYWQRLDTYFSSHADIMFSHGICPDCIKEAYNQMGGRSFPEGSPSAAESGRKGSREPVEDDAHNEMQELLRKSKEEGNPLAPDLERVADRYAKLLRRFNKIVSISDGYQSQFMDLKARLEVSARTDLLTGLVNRWEIMARLEAEKSRAERHGHDFSVLIGDLDHFKEINDTHGHLAGDRVLKMVADVLRSNLRNEDLCGRWGGEEFMVILPETDSLKARLVADKLLTGVRGLSVAWDGGEIVTTMSMGVGGFTKGMSIDECIRQVDDALYVAKSGGRDRVVMAGEG